MKLLTINIHSHDSTFDPAVLKRHMTELAAFVHDHGIDMIAIQEAAQEMDQPAAEGKLPMRWINNGQVLRNGNAALVLAQALAEYNEDFTWTWTGVKLGYDRFEEGLAVFSRPEITETDSFWISGSHDFENWKSRKALTARVNLQDKEAVIACVHMGWWNDPEEAFEGQMERLQAALPADCQIYLMGDFNAPAGVSDEGWEMLKRNGWLDSYELAEKRDAGITVTGEIDGWRSGVKTKMRLDYIWLRKPEDVRTSEVVFNGKKGPVISDHFGVLIELADYE